MREMKQGLFPFDTIRRHMRTKIGNKELAKETVNETNRLISYVLLNVSEELSKIPYRRLHEYHFKEAAIKWLNVDMYNSSSLATIAKLEATLVDLGCTLDELKRKRAEIYGEADEEEEI